MSAAILAAKTTVKDQNNALVVSILGKGNFLSFTIHHLKIRRGHHLFNVLQFSTFNLLYIDFNNGTFYLEVVFPLILFSRTGDSITCGDIES